MRKIRKSVAALVAGVVAALAAQTALAAEPIKLGFSMSLTGSLANTGRVALAAQKLWESDINAQGGLLGRPVKLVYYDDQSSPANVPAIYTKLIDVDKVDLIVSPYSTVQTAPQEECDECQHHACDVTLVRRGDGGLLSERRHLAR